MYLFHIQFRGHCLNRMQLHQLPGAYRVASATGARHNLKHPQRVRAQIQKARLRDQEIVVSAIIGVVRLDRRR